MADVVALNPVADNTLYESPTGALSNGAGGAMFVGRNSAASNSIRRALLRFDIAGNIPAGAIITGVELTLVEAGSNAGNQTVRLHRALESWGEGASVSGVQGGGGGTAAAAGDATWLHRFFNTTTWSTPGGVFDAAISSSTVVGAAGTYTWLSSPQFVTDVQSFLDSPSDNFGWMIMGNEAAASTAKRFVTREDPTLALRPVLRITYIPTPGAAALLTTLTLVAVRRRR